MNLLTYITWLLGPILETALLVVMVRRGAKSRFPRFFAYILFQVLKSAVLFLIYHYYSYDSENYFYAYWTGNAVSVLLSMTVLDEIWRSLFRGYDGIQSLGSTLFRWACAVMILIAIVGAATFQQSSADRVLTVVLALDRNMRQMQCGVFLLVLLLCRTFRNFWRDHVFGIALGFGVFAGVELALVTFLSRFGEGHIASVSLIKSMAYTAVLSLWIGYLRRPEAIRERMPSQVTLWNSALIPQAPHDSNQPFLAMVEGAVERVLSRTAPWPKSAMTRARIVSRRPGAEDCN